MDEISLHMDKYLPYLEDENISDDDKRLLLQTLYEIVTACVQLGFSIHPTQLTCGQRQEDLISATKTAQNHVNCPHPSNKKLMSAASDLTQDASAESEQ